MFILCISGVHISESKWCYNAIPSVHYFHVKTNILTDFQICISVLLSKESNEVPNGDP